VRRVKAEDLDRKRILESGDKLYFEDLGIRTAVRGFSQREIGKVVENAVLADDRGVAHLSLRRFLMGDYARQVGGA
jgi:hypothetical protein